jgi:hypothetical protein
MGDAIPFVQYGRGFSAGDGWLIFDASPMRKAL